MAEGEQQGNRREAAAVASPRDEFDALADFERSLAECYAAVRERMAAGGPGWSPP